MVIFILQVCKHRSWREHEFAVLETGDALLENDFDLQDRDCSRAGAQQSYWDLPDVLRYRYR